MIPSLDVRLWTNETEGRGLTPRNSAGGYSIKHDGERRDVQGRCMIEDGGLEVSLFVTFGMSGLSRGVGGWFLAWTCSLSRGVGEWTFSMDM